MKLKHFVSCLLIVFPALHFDSLAQCPGGANKTSTTTGSWSTGSNWTGGTSPGCSINTENYKVVVNVNMNLPSSSCGGGNLSMTAKTRLEVTSNSTLTIDGNLNLAGEEICIYVAAGSTLHVLGNVNFSKNKVTMVVNGTFTVDGAFGCSGDCTGGGATFPAFGGSGTYSAGGGCTGFGGGQPQCSGALPIELLEFNALANNGYVLLEWSTASELNNDFFTVEKLIDFESPQIVATVVGSGNSNKKIEYNAIDPYPSEGSNYYRLKQTDFDGKSAYSKIESVNYTFSAPLFTLHPNPWVIGNDIYIKIHKPSAILLSMYDVKGQLIFSDYYPDSGHSITLNQKQLNLSSGVYIVNVKSDNTSVSQKLIVYP